jgi:hypothetical protein
VSLEPTAEATAEGVRARSWPRAAVRGGGTVVIILMLFARVCVLMPVAWSFLARGVFTAFFVVVNFEGDPTHPKKTTTHFFPKAAPLFTLA